MLVDQPWVLLGRRIASPPATLDAAWLAVLTALRSDLLRTATGAQRAGALAWYSVRSMPTGRICHWSGILAVLADLVEAVRFAAKLVDAQIVRAGVHDVEFGGTSPAREARR